MERSIQIPKLVVALCIALIYNSLGAQQKDWPVSEWRTVLGLKKDIAHVRWGEVLSTLAVLEASQCCEALRLLYKDADRENTRYHIRLSLLNHALKQGSCPCTDYPSTVELLQEALRQAYEIGDHHLATHVNLSLARACFSDSKLGLSVTYYLMGKEMMEQEGLHHFRNYSNTLYGLADMLYRSRDYRASISIDEKAMVYRGTTPFNQMDSLDNYWKMNVWNRMGLCYKRLGLYDSAFYAFNQGFILTNDDFWKGLLKGNRGDLFFFQERYDSAEVLLRYDYEQSMTSGEYDNAAISLQRLSQIANSRGKHAEALAMIREAKAVNNKAPNWEHESQILHTNAMIFKDLGIADSAFIYMEQYKALSDRIEKYAAESRSEVSRLHLDNQKFAHEIISLRKDKGRILLIRNFTIALIIVLAVVGYLYITRLRVSTKLRQQEAIAEKQKAEAEALKAKEQLQLFTESLREKTLLIESLQSRVTQKELQQQQIGQIEELTQYTILTDTDWDRFKSLFTKVYPGFFVDIKQRIPDITVAEQRMAALIKLRITIKDAAAMLGVSQNSIYKTRQRLRSRLGLAQDADLDEFFLTS